MLGYNGSIPGPTLHVDQGSEITVHVTNEGDVEATVHWHGLRLENRYDGVPHEMQSPIPIGGEFTYKVQFPDAGFYWYHPHIREDFGLEMGLYGTIIVQPSDPSYWPPADRQLSVTVDDLLVEDGHVAPFHRSGPNYTAMGRFPRRDVGQRGDHVLRRGGGRRRRAPVLREYREYADLQHRATRRPHETCRWRQRSHERETFVDEVMLAPSERAVLDVMFENPGEVRLEHRTPDRTYDLGAIVVAGESTGSANGLFDDLRVDRSLAPSMRRSSQISSGRRTRCSRS